jgi:hypothetical protein
MCIHQQVATLVSFGAARSRPRVLPIAHSVVCGSRAIPFLRGRYGCAGRLFMSFYANLIGPSAVAPCSVGIELLAFGTKPMQTMARKRAAGIKSRGVSVHGFHSRDMPLGERPTRGAAAWPMRNAGTTMSCGVDGGSSIIVRQEDESCTILRKPRGYHSTAQKS